MAEQSIQMHGGTGMSWQLPLARHARRLLMIDHRRDDEAYHLER
jgi:hypothetical protein